MGKHTSNSTRIVNEEDEDIIRDILEYENTYFEFRKRSKESRKKILTNKVIANAIKRLSKHFIGSPEEFPEAVIGLLKEEGYEVKFLTYKRIWRIYEEMVKKKIIRDFLNVVI